MVTKQTNKDSPMEHNLEGISFHEERENEESYCWNTIDNCIKIYVQRIKLAVAISVIKSTPSNTTPENYARNLVQMFTTDVAVWKSKCQELEQEVLSLEQRLHIIELKEKTNLSFICADMLGNDDVLLSRTEEQNLTTYPRSDELEKKVCETMEFVRSFILLGSFSVTCNLNFKDSKSESKRKQVLLKSISTLFGHLKSEAGLNLPFKIVKQAVDEILRLFDIKHMSLEVELVRICMPFVEDLLIDIHKTTEINQHDFLHRRSFLIQMLAEHISLTPLILSHLLREIRIMCDFLVSMYREDNEDFTPLLRLENIYYVLQSTEGVLNIMRSQNSSLNVIKIPKELLTEWNKATNESLTNLGSHCSMFCIYIWHIKSLLRHILNTDSVQ